ncbi:hypothetical protein OB952_07985 [Aeromonas salmonicida]|uniref:hypothetical protein n=1 Tax=Aeromonas salmonicida TaxID=645 RepID=UPI00259F28F9|nr:hypothetical protein [Aeromonas salmonicida]MDM5067304.1 hypothetical protein [Aeromonas salmonicida]
MAKQQKGDRTGQTPATDADNEQHSGELPQEQNGNATDTPQPDANAGTGATDGASTGEGSDSDPERPTDDQAPSDAAGVGTAPLTGSAATDGGNEQQRGGYDPESEPIPDERVLVRFTGPWKNYSRGDLTRLPPAEADLVIKKELAESEPEPDEE